MKFCENLFDFILVQNEDSALSFVTQNLRYNRLDCRKKSPMTSQKTIEAAQVAGRNGFSLISVEKFRRLYANLLLCAMLDDRLRVLGGYRRWNGWEAGSAGVTACLRSGDSVVPTPHGLLASYLHSGSLLPTRGKTPATIAQLAAATGEALRHKLEKLGHIAVVFSATGEPERMHEVFAVAARQSLPVIYILESEAPLGDVFEGIPVIRVDGSDTIAVYRVAHESITRAREGNGPTIMECAVWPCGDEPHDPLAKLEDYLAGKRLFRQEWKQRLEKKYASVLDRTIAAAGMN